MTCYSPRWLGSEGRKRVNKQANACTGSSFIVHTGITSIKLSYGIVMERYREDQNIQD